MNSSFLFLYWCICLIANAKEHYCVVYSIIKINITCAGNRLSKKTISVSVCERHFCDQSFVPYGLLLSLVSHYSTLELQFSDGLLSNSNTEEKQQLFANNGLTYNFLFRNFIVALLRTQIKVRENLIISDKFFSDEPTMLLILRDIPHKLHTLT